MKQLASCRFQRTRGTNEHTAGLQRSRGAEALKWLTGAREPQRYSEQQEAIEFMNSKQSRLLATLERKQKLMSGGHGKKSEESPPERPGLGRRVSEEEIELLETSEEMRELVVGKRKATAEGWRVSDASRVVLDRKTPSEIESTEAEAGLRGTTIRRCSKELGVGSGQSAPEGDQSSVSSECFLAC